MNNTETQHRAAQERHEAAEEIPQLRQIERRCVKLTAPEFCADAPDAIGIAKAALERIANMDYRGNRSQESCIAFHALAEMSKGGGK